MYVCVQCIKCRIKCVNNCSNPLHLLMQKDCGVEAKSVDDVDIDYANTVSIGKATALNLQKSGVKEWYTRLVPMSMTDEYKVLVSVNNTWLLRDFTLNARDIDDTLGCKEPNMDDEWLQYKYVKKPKEYIEQHEEGV